MGSGIKTEIKLDGVKELSTFLEQLPKRVAKKAVTKAVGAGAVPIVKAARAEAPDQSGLLRKSQTKKVKTYPNGNAVAIIGANKATQGEYKGRKRVPAFYMHLVAGGTKPHSIASGADGRRKRVRTAVLAAITGGKQHPGAKANPFLERAFNATKGIAAQLMEKALGDILTQEAAKLATGGGK